MSPEDALYFAGAVVDLTPPAGLPMGGYVARSGSVSAGAHDPLEGALLTLRDGRPGGERVTWVVLDAVAVDGELSRGITDAVNAGLRTPTGSVLVAATHTHAGPAGWVRGIHPASQDLADEAMRHRLVEQIGAAAARLAGVERPVRLLVADGPAPGVGTNRGDPAGPHDASVGCLAMVDPSGAVAGLLVDHACHATVLGHDNLHWSADWPGAARRTLAVALAGRSPFRNGEDHPAESVPGVAAAGEPTRLAPVAAVAQGAAGDISPRFVRRAQSYAEVDRLGGLLAAHTLRALLAARLTPGPSPRLMVRHAMLTLPTRPLPSPAEARRWAAEAEASWRSVAASKGASPQERVARTRHEGASLLAELATVGLAPAMDLPMTVVALGDDAWLHLPVELFASLGLDIRAASPFAHTRIIGYTNGYFGYIADEEAHAAGVYEAAASLFDVAAGRQLVDTSIDLLRRARTSIDPTAAGPPAAAPGALREPPLPAGGAGSRA